MTRQFDRENGRRVPLGSRRDMLLGGAMLAAGAAAFAFKPRHLVNLLGDNKLEALVPKQFDGWKFLSASGLVLPPADSLSDKIYSQLLTRTYQRGDHYVMLLIAYSAQQDGTVQVHRPEVCYPASGFTLTRNTPYEVALGPKIELPTRYIVADRLSYVEQMLYWTRIGPYFPGRWIEQREAVAKSNLKGDIPDGVLVRVSAAGPGDQRPLLGGFVESLFRSVNPEMRSVLVGTS